MTEINKMYSERVGNIPVMRYCNFKCVYCAFDRFTKISPCEKCRTGINHAHLEVLSRIPPKTAPGRFLTVGLSGDVSFMTPNEFCVVLDYCEKWSDRTFVIQSKNPEYFLKFPSVCDPESSNIILGTTLETNNGLLYQSELTEMAYNQISQAPYPCDRIIAMKKLTCRKAITIEPILRFNLGEFKMQIQQINPEFVYIGYANDKHQGKKLKLPEPTLEKTMRLITELREAGIEVREKTLRKAWYEE
jgi:hypothetical protein